MILRKIRVWWSDINVAFDSDKFDQLYEKMIATLPLKKLYIRDAFIGADPAHRMKIRIIDTQALAQFILLQHVYQAPS